MKVSEAAHLWVFSDKLSDKLYWPESFEWDAWSALEDMPATPGRPSALSFTSDQSTKTSFPSLHHLERPQVRGEVLHFFANHELLALELMALTILKFPKAPRAFLQGLLQTLRDEQIHLRFYLERMNHYGVEFGSVRVNRFFWDQLASSKTPLQYTTGMALTFEQANLDFSFYYQKAFEKIGDTETAEALHQVFIDEIRHVAYGLHWFDRWRDPNSNRWQAYKDSLEYPLTPQRAKGKSFHKESRIEAGLDSHFIESLRVYSHSTGRVPRVFLFNPDCEDENAEEKKHYNRPKKIQMLADDLAFLPAFLAHSSDIVLMPENPPRAFLLNLQEAGIPLPEIILRENFSQTLQHRLVESFEPWGRTPSTDTTAQSLTCSHFQLHQRELFSKVWSCEALKDYVAQSEEKFICSPNEVGQAFSCTEKLVDASRNLQEQGFQQIVLKAPFGASGRNFQRLDSTINNGMPTAGQMAWASKIISKQGAIIVEPWLNKEFDYSLQISVQSNGETTIAGTARFLVDKGGRYQGALLGGFYTGLSVEQKRFLNNSGEDPHLLKKHFETLAEYIGKRAHQFGYSGAIGIDALVFRNLNGELKIKPIVETNCRWNMGRLVVELEKKLNLPGEGLWQVIPYDANLLQVISKQFKPLSRDSFNREEYFYLICSHSIHQNMMAVLFWGPDHHIIQQKLQLTLPQI